MNSQAPETRTQPRFQQPGTGHSQPASKARNQMAAAAKSSAAKAVRQEEAPATGAVQPNAAQETTFHIDAPSAKAVMLAGEFTQWDKAPLKMTKGGGGKWHIKVSLAPGRHRYRFLVDGEWQNDQSQHERVPNPYGTFDNVIQIH
jgi:1,4-alpha-glucan branching enzyme